MFEAASVLLDNVEIVANGDVNNVATVTLDVVRTLFESVVNDAAGDVRLVTTVTFDDARVLFESVAIIPVVFTCSAACGLFVPIPRLFEV